MEVIANDQRAKSDSEVDFHWTVAGDAAST
jgi:hypothetical protein